MKKFAEGTEVPISRSRDEIMRLLRDWKADRIAWADDFEAGRAVLQFVWKHEGDTYGAEISVELPNDETLKKQCIHSQTGEFLPVRFRALQDGRGRREHRLLLLWLKAALNAVDAGIISAEAIFLPFLKGRDGQTVAATMLPRMRDLLTMPASALLGPSRG